MGAPERDEESEEEEEDSEDDFESESDSDEPSTRARVRVDDDDEANKPVEQLSLTPEIIALLAAIDEPPPRAALETGRATAIIGAVKWSRDRQELEASTDDDDYDEAALRMPLGRFCEGRYRFFVLDKSNVIVAAEPLDHPKKYEVTHRALLLQVLQMSESDLELNRKGTLTKTQRKNRKRDAIAARIIGVFLWVMFAAMCSLTIFTCSPSVHIESWVSLLTIGLSTMMGLFAWAVTNAARKAKQNIDSNVVSVEGILTDRSSRTVKNTTLYSITIGDKRFDVGSPIYSSVCTNVTYRAHYAKDGDQLVALEPVASESSTPYR